MNYTSLRYFLTVVAEGNITKAAQKLFITQQSLSEHIVRLETEYGVKLFDRFPTFRLTYAGTRLYNLAEKLVNLDKQIQIEMSDISQEHKGSLSIGITPSYGKILIPEIWAQFNRLFPNIELQISFNNSNELLQMLQKRSIDISCSLISEVSTFQFERNILFQERYCILIPQNIIDQTPDFASFPFGCSIDPHILEKIPFIMPNKGSHLRSMAELYLSKLNFYPNIILETNDIMINAQFCSQGAGVYFCDELFADYIVKNCIHYQPIYIFYIDDLYTDLKFSISYHRDFHLSKAAKALIDLTKEVIEGLSIPQNDKLHFHFKSLTAEVKN